MPWSPPPNLRLGVRALHGLPGIEILDALTYDESVASWVLRICLTIATSSELVPITTEWYVLIDPEYPTGLAQFHPAQNGGIHATFRHMKRNDPTDHAWRSGVPCLDRPGRWLGNTALSGQPNSAFGKLRFHTESALRWLDCAARNALTGEEERFELPSFAEQSATVIGFDESPDRLARWNSFFGRCGRAEVRWIGEHASVVDHHYQRLSGDDIVQSSRWGSHIMSLTDASNIFWLTLPKMPVVAPWAAPKTWGELRTVSRSMGVNLDELLKKIYAKVRENPGDCVPRLIVGFPIPAVYDGPAMQMHWQPLNLPEVINAGRWCRQSSRETRSWELQKMRTFNDDATIVWSWSENWSEGALRIRGALDERVSKAQIALIGAGALGSALAEMLVREGVRNISVFENDWLEVGNLRRHVLTMNDISEFKAVSLAKRLNDISPFANAQAIPGITSSSQDYNFLQKADIVIDCTANEDAMTLISRHLDDGKIRWFFSGSFGIDADRLFFYYEHGSGIDTAFYNSEMAGPLSEERRKIDERGLDHMQTAGCWNPVFPARWSKIQIRASEMLNAIETAVKSDPTPDKRFLIIPLLEA